MGTEEQIAFDEILEYFDFEKCAKAMRALGWTYYGQSWTPTVGELKDVARGHFERLKESPETRSTNSGGLKLSRVKCDGMHKLVLEFVLADWDSDVRPV